MKKLQMKLCFTSFPPPPFFPCFVPCRFLPPSISPPLVSSHLLLLFVFQVPVDGGTRNAPTNRQRDQHPAAGPGLNSQTDLLQHTNHSIHFVRCSSLFTSHAHLSFYSCEDPIKTLKPVSPFQIRLPASLVKLHTERQRKDLAFDGLKLFVHTTVERHTQSVLSLSRLRLLAEPPSTRLRLP